MRALPWARWLFVSLVIATMASLAAALVFAYESGCAGDLKAGTWGDMQRALQFDSDSGVALMLTFVFVTAAVVARGRSGASAFIGLGTALATVVVTWVLSWQFETWGNAACFPR
jgi:hypothetical protein